MWSGRSHTIFAPVHWDIIILYLVIHSDASSSYGTVLYSRMTNIIPLHRSVIEDEDFRKLCLSKVSNISVLVVLFSVHILCSEIFRKNRRFWLRKCLWVKIIFYISNFSFIISKKAGNDNFYNIHTRSNIWQMILNQFRHIVMVAWKGMSSAVCNGYYHKRPSSYAVSSNCFRFCFFQLIFWIL